MKKAMIVFGLLCSMAVSAYAFDGASGIGTGGMKLELGYTGGAAGLQFDYGLSQDWTVFGVISVASGFTGIGVGTKYAIFNEKKGDGFSLAPGLQLLIGSGGVIPVPGIVVSKRLNEKFTVLGDAWVWSAGFVNVSWLGGGVLYNINENLQVGGQLGVNTTAVNFLGYRYAASGAGFGIGLNYLF